jgi:leucyl aminopeptidase
MIKFKFFTKELLTQTAGCYVFFVEQDFKFLSALHDVAKMYFPPLQTLMKERKFIGSAQSTLSIPVVHGKGVTNLLFIGLGKPTRGKKNIDVENFRRALGTMIRCAEKNNESTLAFTLPDPKLFGVSAEYLGKQVATIVTMAAYQFDKFITDKDRLVRHDFDIMLGVLDKDKVAVERGITEGHLIADALNSARGWSDSPAAVHTPTQMANEASKIAKEHGLKATVFDGKKIVELGMGGLSGVAQGSDQDPRFVILEYKTHKKKAPTIGLVGKGITFDSGGLSLKPANSMETMKDDMSGAATVIATMKALAQLQPDVNVIAVTPLAENLPGPRACKPGDIFTFYNGKTAEVLNTDAEGRLILADALSYITTEYKLDALVDIATLTGACQYALGPFYCGLMSQHDELTEKVKKASATSGENVWPLPFVDDYKPAIKSEFADIKNVGDQRYMAGTITAGFFLQNFVGDVPWVHLDVAGTSFNVPGISYFRSGATGFGVRLFVDLIMNW